MENIKPEDIVKILAGHGIKVTLDEANIVLEFVLQLANMALDQYLKL
ncbi:MAG: hypothetical protein J0H07_07990 [Sphingobacteriales bacterium]|nr:hypothetical protein [Sphingobacteriales bacterium]